MVAPEQFKFYLSSTDKDTGYVHESFRLTSAHWRMLSENEKDAFSGLTGWHFEYGRALACAANFNKYYKPRFEVDMSRSSARPGGSVPSNYGEMIW